MQSTNKMLRERRGSCLDKMDDENLFDKMTYKLRFKEWEGIQACEGLRLVINLWCHPQLSGQLWSFPACLTIFLFAVHWIRSASEQVPSLGRVSPMSRIHMFPSFSFLPGNNWLVLKVSQGLDVAVFLPVATWTCFSFLCIPVWTGS